MIKDVLTHIGGIGIYGIISICLFFAVFVGVLIWTFTLNPRYRNTMRRLPLEDDSGPDAARSTPSRDD